MDNDLKEIDVVGLVVDAIAMPVSPTLVVPAKNYDSNDMLLYAGDDEDGKATYIQNMAQLIESFRTLEIKLRSRRSDPINVAAIVRGLRADTGVLVLVGTSPKRLEPGGTTKITIETEHGIYNCQLNLMTCACPEEPQPE